MSELELYSFALEMEKISKYLFYYFSKSYPVAQNKTEVLMGKCCAILQVWQ